MASSEQRPGPAPEEPREGAGPVRRLPPPAVWEGIAAATGVRSAPDPEALRRSLDEDADDERGAQEPDAVVVPQQRRGARARRWSTPVLLGAAGLALVVGAAGGALVASRVGQEAVSVVSTARLAPLEAGGAAGWTGTAEVVQAPGGGGRRVVVTTSGLPAVDGAAHEVWLLDPATGGLVALGALAGGRSPQDGYVVPDGVDLSQYSQVDVSAEPLDGDTTHSGATELRGPLTTA